MARKAPGKSHRKGLTLLQIADMFREEDVAKAWLAEQRWPDGPKCPHCGTKDVQSNIKHKTMTHRCRRCEGKPMFSIKTGTVMEGSNLKYRVWAVGIYLFTTNIKGISSMKLHREVVISQKAAWFMLVSQGVRIRWSSRLTRPTLAASKNSRTTSGTDRARACRQDRRCGREIEIRILPRLSRPPTRKRSKVS